MNQGSIELINNLKLQFSPITENVLVPVYTTRLQFYFVKTTTQAVANGTIFKVRLDEAVRR